MSIAVLYHTPFRIPHVAAHDSRMSDARAPSAEVRACPLAAALGFLLYPWTASCPDEEQRSSAPACFATMSV
jgi:hypothetical protein